MSRPVFCLDITSFRSAQDRDRFLAWACRKLHGTTDTDHEAETTASAMQSSTGGIELIGAWLEDPGDRAFTLYACHGGWAGGWRQMLQLYIGVPESLFLSAIDDLRYSAETLALLGAPGNPLLTELASGVVAGADAVLELITVPPGMEPVCLQDIRSSAGTSPLQTHRLALAFELGYRDCTVGALWIADGQMDLIRWRQLRGLPDGPESEVIGLRAYPGPAMSAAIANLPASAGSD